MSSRNLSVLQIGPFPPPHGGVAANLMAIRNHLKEHAVREGVINIIRPRKDNVDAVWSPEGTVELLRLLFTLPYRIVHLHIGGGFSLRLVGLCLAVASIPGKRSVMTFHSGGYPTSPEGQSAARWTLRGCALRRLDRIICVNEEMVSMFKRFGVSENKIRLILPFSLPKELPKASLIPLLAEFFGRHSPVIMSVSGLEPEYDVARQIEAFQVIHEQHSQAGLVIIGSGSLEAALRSQLAGKSYRDHALICGDIPHAVTLRAIYESALLWRTTLYDGDAVSVREALHLGVPVIATDNKMRPPGVTVIPVADTPALQRATLQVLDAPPQRERQLQTGETNMERIMALYNELA